MHLKSRLQLQPRRLLQLAVILVVLFVCKQLYDALTFLPLAPDRLVLQHGKQMEQEAVRLVFQDGTQLEQDDLRFVFQHGNQLEQDHVRLLKVIRKHFLHPPSPHPYNLKNPTGDPSAEMGIWKFAHQLLGEKKHGFFIECGGLDGEFYSNTLVLERDFGWRGLLVEADPDYIPKLIATHRNVWFADVCLSLNPWPQMAKMQMKGRMGWSVISNQSSSIFKSTIEVKCIPLFSLLSALGVFTVDYFSLDIEGNELRVLQTIPFDKVFIKALNVETRPETKNGINAFLLSKGYKYMRTMNKSAQDDIYLHNSLVTA